ncbi:unnamed protein product [Dovyalis caffra]|uniref:B-like cyclin n=1 Tax=Dovyalis caffra TaxID=77055 RepID=A0AAV1R899_9ROSI|nr:unnamed protein product [Dovyalis caffra]
MESRREEAESAVNLSKALEIRAGGRSARRKHDEKETQFTVDMGENENQVQCTRSSSSRKRAPEAHPLPPSNKKRVPLGELTNFLNITTAPITNNSDYKISESKYAAKEDDSPPSTELSRDSDFENSHEIECDVKEGNKNVSENSSSTESTQNSGLRRCSYASSIYRYLHSLEMEDNRRCLSNYMREVQNDVSVNMREILVDWLVEVAEEYRLVSDTLHLTVSYIDRFLSSQALSRNKLQLLGVSCMLIASKYEEISPPHVENFCHITDNTYTKDQIVVRVHELLSGRTKFARIWVRALLTINDCCISCFPFKFHDPATYASLDLREHCNFQLWRDIDIWKYPE